jgi:membrane-associated phospholipid phosphatase
VVVVAVVLICAAVAALVAALVTSRVPDFDPSAPRLKTQPIRRELKSHPRLAAMLNSRLDPTAATGLALTVAFILVLGGAVVGGALFVMVQHNALLARWDMSAARWGASHAAAGSTRFLKDVSTLGGTLVIVAASVVTAVVMYIRTRRAVVIWFLLVVVGGQSIVSNVTKVLVGRDRPNVDRLTGFSGASFPSGHATAAAATFAAIALLLGMGKSHRTKVVLASGAAAIAAAVAATRVLLGVHWLTDVLAGLAMGWAWFAISSIAFGGRLLSFGQPARVVQQEAEEVVDDHPGGTNGSTGGHQAMSTK